MESNDEKLNQIKSKVNLDNLKSVYFLMNLFEYIEKKKYLEIMKYNKKIQTRLKISIKDYLEYSRTYSSIEIKLNFVNEKVIIYSKLINIPKENRKYYHIYSENSNEEMIKTELNDNEKFVCCFAGFLTEAMRNAYFEEE